MKFRLYSSPDDLSRGAADEIAAIVRRSPDLLLAAPAGSTPTLTYRQLVATRDAEPELFRHLRLVALDEWGGLAPGDPGTCAVQLQNELIRPLGLAAERVRLWSSSPSDAEAECARVAAWLAEQGPIGLCLLGIGLNGHLALNEPAATHRPDPHVSRLAGETLTHPMLTKSGAVPKFGLTLGLGDLLRARKIRVLVQGFAKRGVLAQLRERRVDPWFPASFLWLHPDVEVLACDES